MSRFDAKIRDLGVAKILENINHKSDILALGCISQELLTFNHPFTATNKAALFIKILNSKYNPFTPGVPEDLNHKDLKNVFRDWYISYTKFKKQC